MSVTITDAQYGGYHSSSAFRSRLVIDCEKMSETNDAITVKTTMTYQVKTSAANTTVRESQDVGVDIFSVQDSSQSGAGQFSVTLTSPKSVKCVKANTWYTLYSFYRTTTFTKSTSVKYVQAVFFECSGYISGDQTWVINDNNRINIFTIPKKSYTISYNANGGTGAPASQTKVHGTTLVLTNSKPTRSEYSFYKWNTKASGTGGTEYSPGDNYTANGDATLYARWNPLVSSLTIGSAKVIRVADSSSTTEADEGTCAYITVPFTCKGTAAGRVSFSISGQETGGDPITVTKVETDPMTKSANTDLSGTFHARASNLDIEKRYTFTVTLTAANTSYSSQTAKTAAKTLVLPMAFFTMDVLAGGKGVAFGKPSTRSGLDIGMAAYTGKTLTFENAELDRDGANPQSTTYGTAYPRWVDNSGELVGLIRSSRLTDGTQRLAIAAYNEVSGEDVNNGIILCVGTDGSKSYTVGDPGAFCDAILATGYAEGMNAKIASLSGTTQIWRLMANCVNTNNADSRNGHQIGINVNNTDLSVYDYTSSASMYRLYSDKYTANTDTAADICTAGTNITINSASYRERAGMACFEVKFTPSAAISSATTVFTLASGKRPALTTNGCDSSTTYCCLVNTSGTVQCRRALTSDTSYTFRATYMLA